MNKYIINLFFITLSIILFVSPKLLLAQLTLTAESGLAFNGYNNVRYFNKENDKGTLFSLTDDFETTQPVVYARFELKWRFANKNVIELTAAPLAFDYTKNDNSLINFGENQFGATGSVDGRYEFNTYRASYRYVWIDKDKWYFDAGASVLIRDARISLQEDNTAEETTDLGFVPLISFDLRYHCSESLSFLLKGDALVGTQGRAEDVLIGINKQIFNEHFNLRAGYRIIEGGADVSQVYNFSLIHFAAVGLSYQF